MAPRNYRLLYYELFALRVSRSLLRITFFVRSHMRASGVVIENAADSLDNVCERRVNVIICYERGLNISVNMSTCRGSTYSYIGQHIG
jgi:hypothetical protein